MCVAFHCLVLQRCITLLCCWALQILLWASNWWACVWAGAPSVVAEGGKQEHLPALLLFACTRTRKLQSSVPMVHSMEGVRAFASYVHVHLCVCVVPVHLCVCMCTRKLENGKVVLIRKERGKQEHRTPLNTCHWTGFQLILVRQEFNFSFSPPTHLT